MKVNIRKLPVLLRHGPAAYFHVIIPPVDGDEVRVAVDSRADRVRVNGAEVEPISSNGIEELGDIVYRASNEFSQVYVLDDGSVVRLFDAVGQWNCNGRWEGGGE